MQKSIRLCLIDVKVPGSYGGTPLNLLSLGSYLVANKILDQRNIKIINSNKPNTLERVLQFKPDIIGMSVVTPAFPNAIKLAKFFKKHLSALLVIGGHHITGIPQLFSEPFDIGVMGEGEGALADIVEILQKRNLLNEKTLSSIPNLVFRKRNGSVQINPMRPLLAPDKIPSYTWSLLKPEEIVRYETVVENGVARVALGASIFSSRGCPYQCAFCARTIIWKIGSPFRLLPINRVMQEIEYLYHHYHITSLWILDDTFAVSKERIRQLIQALREKDILGNIVFPQVFVRANLIDEEFVLLLKQLGVLTVFIGIESGSPKILKYLKNGSLKISQVKKAIPLFAKQNIRVIGSFMLFVSNETKTDIDRTYALGHWFSHQSNAFALAMYVTVPFPGTKLWNDAIVNKNINISKIQWKNFITYRSKKSIADTVFFRNGLSNKQLDYYWNRMIDETDYVTHIVHNLPNWRSSEQRVDVFNKHLDAKLEMRYRMERIFHNPMRFFLKLSEARVWKYVYRDITRFLKK